MQRVEQGLVNLHHRFIRSRFVASRSAALGSRCTSSLKDGH